MKLVLCLVSFRPTDGNDILFCRRFACAYLISVGTTESWNCMRSHQVGCAIVGRTARCHCKFRQVWNFTISLSSVNIGPFMYAKHATLSTRTHLAPKPWITFTGHTRSGILGSLKSRRATAYYCIIMWSLKSEMSEERSEHIRFLEPHCHSAPLSIGNPANICTNIILSSLIVWMCAFIFIRFLWRARKSNARSKTASLIVKDLRFKEEDKDKESIFKARTRTRTRTRTLQLVLEDARGQIFKSSSLSLSSNYKSLSWSSSSEIQVLENFPGLSRLSVSALYAGVRAGVVMT